MLSTSLILGWTLLAQVPPPAIGQSEGDDLKACREAILKREAKELEALAERLARRGDPDEVAAVRRLLATASAHLGVNSFAPLPQVVPGRGEGLASIAGKPGETTASSERQKLEQVRSQAACELFALAKRAAATSPPHLAQTALCLRAILEREPDHPEAHRLMGYVPYKGGWARPFAVRQLKAGNVDHPTFSAGFPRTGSFTSTGASSPRLRAEGKSRSAGSPLARPIHCGQAGRTPGRSRPSTLKSRPTCRWAKPSNSHAGWRRFMTSFSP